MVTELLRIGSGQGNSWVRSKLARRSTEALSQILQVPGELYCPGTLADSATKPKLSWIITAKARRRQTCWLFVEETR